MARVGKINRLPLEIREELNLRMQNGEATEKTLEWLNALPETQAVLAEKFGGEPMNDVNISRWRRSGFREWEARKRAGELLEECKPGASGAGIPTAVADRLGQWLAVRYAAVAQEATEDVEDVKGELEVLRELTKDVGRLRRGEHSAERVRMQSQSEERKRKMSQEDFANWVLKQMEDPKYHKDFCKHCSKPVSYTKKLQVLGKAIFGDDW